MPLTLVNEWLKVFLNVEYDSLNDDDSSAHTKLIGFANRIAYACSILELVKSKTDEFLDPEPIQVVLNELRLIAPEKRFPISEAEISHVSAAKLFSEIRELNDELKNWWERATLREDIVSLISSSR